MSSSLTYLITGANRGIGKGIASSLLSRPNTTVIAAVRDVTRSTPELDSIFKASGSKVIIVKLDSSVEADPKNAVAELQSKHGITSIDIVIANAGMMQNGTTVARTSADELRNHFAVNTIGPILLFQAVKPLLQAGKSGNPIFLAVSTGLGSIGFQAQLEGLPQVLSPYGASKAALNWAVVRMHFEEPWATSYVIHPGLVLTDLATSFAEPHLLSGMGGITVEESVAGILSSLDKADRNVSGTFQVHDGTTLPW
jgi:norsolorinic acid ketoreductase